MANHIFSSNDTTTEVKNNQTFGANLTIDILEDTNRGRIDIYEGAARTKALSLLNTNGYGVIGMGSNEELRIKTNNTEIWSFLASGHLRPITDNALLIGDTTHRLNGIYAMELRHDGQSNLGLFNRTLSDSSSKASLLWDTRKLVYSDGTTTKLDWSGTTLQGDGLLPLVDGTGNIGDNTKRWNLVTSSFEIRVYNGSSESLTLRTNQTLPSGGTAQGAIVETVLNSGHLGMFTLSNTNADAVATRNVLIETGNKTAGTGNSGDISLYIGTSSGGTRGKIRFKDGTEGTAGYVWTSSDTTGGGKWQSPYAQYADAIVGSAAQVTAGLATHSTLQAAHDAVTAPARILVLLGTITGNTTITKSNLKIEGGGRGSILSGSITLNSGAVGNLIRAIKTTGNITFNSGADGNFLSDSWIANTGALVDSGAGNQTNYIQET